MPAHHLSKIKYQRTDFVLAKLASDNIDRLTLNLVPNGTRVLELGCANGFQTQALVDKKCQVVGVEINALAASQAGKVASKIIVGDLNHPLLWRQLFKLAKFKVVLASNILEHLINPWWVLKQIYELLPAGGQLVIAVPNIGFWRARLKVFCGYWQYEDYGIFDRDHLRFFTVDSMRQALIDAGFKIEAEAYDGAGGAKFLTPILKLWPNLYAHQVVFKASKD